MSDAERKSRQREKDASNGWIRKEYKIRPHWHSLLVALITRLTKREQK